MSVQQPFNLGLFRVAREFRGLTQESLSRKTGVSQPKLSRIEHAMRPPEGDEITAIARALGFPIDFFYQSEESHPTGLIFHRKKSKLSIKVLRRLEAEAQLRILCLKKLLPELDVEHNIKKFDLHEYSGKPSLIAQALRHYWKLPRGPIKDLTCVLENNGIAVLRFDFGNVLLDGFFVENNLPCIVINSRLPMDRQRFTMAHELGHLLMHEVPYSRVEEEANQFASELLMPKMDINEHFRGKRIDLQYLAMLKPIWRVSMAALLHRAQDLGWLTKSRAQRMWSTMSRLGYRKAEPVPISQEKATLAQEIVHEYKVEKGYTDIEVCHIMNIQESEYFRFFNPFLRFEPNAGTLAGSYF